MIDKKYLAEKHKGMRLNIEGCLRQKPSIIKLTMSELIKHLNEVSDRFYSGDITVVDEFLQLYCLDEKRPKE